MKVAPNKNFVTKTFSESRCEWLCIGDFFSINLSLLPEQAISKCNMQSSYKEKTESTELQAFKWQKDGYKVTVVVYDSKRWQISGPVCPQLFDMASFL